MQPLPITLIETPTAYFQELIVLAFQKNGIKTIPETEVYLVNLLCRFISMKNLFPENQNGRAIIQPLALMFKEALEENQPRAQTILFRNLGDVSLYISGFFKENILKKNVNIDYYMSMGKNAYMNVAHLHQEEILKHVFLELSERFDAFVYALCHISETTFIRHPHQIESHYLLLKDMPPLGTYKN